MIKILLCCGGGFSSSAIATRVQKDIEELGLQDEYQITFHPLGMTRSKYIDILNNYDVIICCPHLQYIVKTMADDPDVNVPIYVLPPKIYGQMNAKEIILDVEDILELYKHNPKNPVIFPGEENTLRVKRNIAYRNFK